MMDIWFAAISVPFGNTSLAFFPTYESVRPCQKSTFATFAIREN